MMAYYIHRLRCWLALMRSAWTQAGVEESHAEWKFRKDVARRQRERADELARQLIEMRGRRVG
jgi:hypothetical protein